MLRILYSLIMIGIMAASPMVMVDTHSHPIPQAVLATFKQDLAQIPGDHEDEIMLGLTNMATSSTLSCQVRNKVHFVQNRVQFGFKSNELMYAIHACADHVAKQWVGHGMDLNGRLAILTQQNDGYQVLQTDLQLHEPQLLFSSKVPIYAMAWKPNAKELAYVIHDQQKWQVKVFNRMSHSHQLMYSSQEAINDILWDGTAQQWMISMAHHGMSKLFGLKQQKVLQITFGDHIDVMPTVAPKRTIFVSNTQDVPELHQMDVNGLIKPLVQTTAWATMPMWFKHKLYWSSQPQGEAAKLMQLDEKNGELKALAERTQMSGLAPTPLGPIIASQDTLEALDHQGQQRASLPISAIALAGSWVYQL